MATNYSIVLLLVLSISCLCSTRDVYIQPSEGEHCPGVCYNITTFGKMAKYLSNSFGLVVHFLEGTHLLDLHELVVFTNLTNTVFEGIERMEQGFHETVWQSTVVIKCTEHSSTGIAFVNSSNITFRYITITNCGAGIAYMHNWSINASLGYLSVSNSIVIDHVSVQNGSGSGLLIETDGVDLTITNSSFAQNGNFNSSVLILHIDPLNCTPQKHVYNTLVANTNISFGKSGGLAICMLQGIYSVAIVLDYVTAYGNRGLYGSITILALEHEVPTYNLTINNTVSSNAQDTTALNIHSSYIILDDYKQCRTKLDHMANLTIFIVNSKFSYNNISGHGPVMRFGLLAVTFTSKITIESTEICNNIGSGVIFYHFTKEQQVQLVVTLSNVMAENNSHPSNNDSYTIKADFVTALVLHNVSITDNNMTGLQVYRTAIVVKGTSVFHNNTGIDGGGLGMYGDSYLVFGEDSILNFTNNRAKQKGGAIFVSTKQELIPCFFQYSDFTLPKSAQVIFSGNTADIAGTVLYGGNIGNCISYNFHYIPSNERFEMTFNYSSQTGPSVISSEPTDVCFCDDNNTINCSQTQLTKTVYPGEEINISVVTVGQKMGVAPGILEIQSLGTIDSNSVLHNSSAMKCTTIAYTSIHRKNLLNVFGFESSKLLNISLSNCPLGFKRSNKTRYCDCEELRHTITTITCDVATKMITRQGDIWIGNISDCVIAHNPCPFDYCNKAQVNFSCTDPDPQCALNRTGILCGRCQDGLSLALGSNNCIQCPQFSYLALIIPFAAAGFGLVAFLMVLNLTVSIGTINGLIFYASIVKISESTGIFFPNGSIPVLSQFIAWLNLDLGIETCFYHGMTAYAKMWLHFLFPLYIWFMVATIIVMCHYSTWLSNKIGGNVVQVLATLILLSFTKIFRIVVLAMKFTTLSCVNSGRIIDRLTWSMDGNVPYFSLKHYILMAAAVLFLILAVPYTLALLFDAVIEKYLTRMRFFRRQWIKFKPFVDAYHGPYKDNCRFWTGLLLLVRISFTLVSLHLDTYVGLIFITTSTSVLLSLMVFFGGVYQKTYLNILEWSSLINLVLLSAIYNPWNGIAAVQQVVTVISVSVALATFMGVIVLHAILRVNFIKRFNKFVKLCKNRDRKLSEKLLEDETNHTCRELVQPTSSDLWLRRESLI